MSKLLSFHTLVAAALAATALGANAAPPAPADAAPVLTRARLVSSFEEPGGKHYARLKLLPRSKIPFTVQAFRVRDPALLDGIAMGATVKFTAGRVDGENTLTSIQPATACVRFQTCD